MAVHAQLPPRPQTLNPAQQAAVETDGHCLVTAGPGSGKTAVMRARAVRKLKRDPMARGIAVTFTRDAANELEGRIFQAYPEGGGRMICGTFHSLCKRQLEEAGIEVELVNEVQQTDLVRRAWQDIMKGRTGINLEQARLFIEEQKSRVHPDLRDPEECLLAAIYYRYQEMLRRIGRMDFADMLVMTAQKMATGQVKRIPGDFLLVDESQDTDPVQMGWVYAYMEQGVEVCIVGDDDQSIYSFRFASGYRSMEEFRVRARATHINLDTSYRCAHEILAPAGRLIEHNAERIAKRLRTQNTTRGRVIRLTCASRDEEIDRLVEMVQETGSLNDWGILARTNKLLETVETGIAKRFEVTRKSNKSFWDLKCPALFLGLVRSLWFDDMVGVDPILRLAGVAEGRIAQIHGEGSSQKRGSLSAYLNSSGGEDPGDPETYFKKVAREWRGLLRKNNYALAADAVAEYMLSRLRLVDPGARNRDEIQQHNKKMLAAASSTVAKTTGSFGHRLANLTREQDPKSAEEERPAAKLMTLHGSKGLEFKYVWMIGCEDGVVPAKGAPVEEERRLFYVGMTRAKQLLVMSHSAAPSPFISECGPLG